jgi:glycosyltransferase involved in cell wall biosynthesis
VPRVSVVINTQNSSRFLRETLNSLLAQSFRDWEAVIWDNASADDTADIVHSYGEARFRFFEDPEKVSLYQSRVNALWQCTGDLVAFLDHDDVWVSEKLQHQVLVFDNPGTVASATDFLIIRSPNRLHLTDQSAKLCRTYRSRVTSRLNLSRHYRVAMSTLMARTDIARVALPNPAPELSVIEDFDIVFRLLAHGALEPIARPLMLYRLHGSNFSSNTEAHRLEVDIWSRSYTPLPGEEGDAAAIRAAVGDSYLRATTRRALAIGDRQFAFRLSRQMTWSLDRVKITAALALPRSTLARLAR